MNITKQFSILEDIYRLIDYLDYLADHEKLHFQQTGYSAQLERDNVLWELKFKIGHLKPHIVDTYFLSFEDITKVEQLDLAEWVDDGNSIFDNPYLIADESGRPMDFINACRFNDALYEEHLVSQGAVQDDVVHPDELDDNLPF